MDPALPHERIEAPGFPASRLGASRRTSQAGASQPGESAAAPRPRRSARRHAALARTAALAIAFALVGCGSEVAPEERLAQTREALVAVREEVRELENRVEERRAAVEGAGQALDRAREELSQTENELGRVRRRLDEHATQVALFRAVQGALLQREALERYAIRVEIADGQVVLRGEVDAQKHADEALEVARTVVGGGADEGGFEGIMEVKSEIRVRGEDGTA